MQVQFREQRAHFLGPPREQRENLALKPFREVTHPRATDRDGLPFIIDELPWLPIAVSAPGGRINRGHGASALVPGSAEECGHFLLQE